MKFRIRNSYVMEGIAIEHVSLERICLLYITIDGLCCNNHLIMDKILFDGVDEM